MLVLSRHVEEIIDITTPDGEVIEVCVVDIRGDKARIGVRADQKFTVHRREITEAIERERNSACPAPTK